VDPFGRYIDLVPNDHGPVPERPDGWLWRTGRLPL